MFRALDRRTGEVRWAAQVGPESVRYFFHGNPLITETLVVIGSDVNAPGATAKIHAFDRLSGRERWSYPAPPGVWGAISGDRRSAFAIKAQKELLALDLESGALRWSSPIEVTGWIGPAVSKGRAIVGGRDGAVHAFNAETGRIEWRTELGAPISTDIAITSDSLFAGTVDGTMHRLDAERGSVRASLKIDATLRPRSMPAVAGDSLLVALADQGEDYRAILAVDSALSKIRWRQDAATGWNTTRIFVWGNTAIVGTSAGEVTAYCASNGSKAWSKAVKGPVRSIGGSNDLIYVTTSDGNLYALAPSSACDMR